MRLSINAKVFGLAAFLLLTSTTVALISFAQIELVNREVVSLANYYPPLSRKLNQIEVVIRNQEISLQSVIGMREPHQVRVSGRLESVRLYEVLASGGVLVALRMQQRDANEQALRAYRGASRATAENHLLQCLELVPEDGPSGVLFERVSLFAKDGNGPAGWDGVWQFDHK